MWNKNKDDWRFDSWLGKLHRIVTNYLKISAFTFFSVAKGIPQRIKNYFFNSLDSAWNSGNYMNGSKWAPNYFLQSHSTVIFLNLQCKTIICYNIYAVCVLHSPCFSLETITQSLHCISLSYFILKTKSIRAIRAHNGLRLVLPFFISIDQNYSPSECTISFDLVLASGESTTLTSTTASKLKIKKELLTNILGGYWFQKIMQLNT